MKTSEKLKKIESILNKLDKDFKTVKLINVKDKRGAFVYLDSKQEKKRNEHNFNACLLALEKIDKIVRKK